MIHPSDKRVRVLYSFPHKIGANRICTAAWHQVDGSSRAGAKVTLFTAAICRPFTTDVDVHTTLSAGNFRLPARLLGTRRYCILHDWIVARKLPRLAREFDVIHVWPLGALRTLKTAKKLGIPTVLERPNAHTRYAYNIVLEECRKLGVPMPPGHEHDFNAAILKHEEEEYALATKLLCPSDFVARTFVERGFSPDQIARHQYGFDEHRYHAGSQGQCHDRGLTVLFAAGCAPRKGLHYALDAWLGSEASKTGTFLVVGEFIPGYKEYLSTQLSHPSVKVLGFRKDLNQIMRESDILVLPSIEEGSALVTSEARGSGCVLLVSEAAGAVCKHGINALVHPVGNVPLLSRHFTELHNDRARYVQLRNESLKSVSDLSWTSAGRILERIYRSVGLREKA